MIHEQVTPARIEQTAATIRSYVRRTPVIEADGAEYQISYKLSRYPNR